MSNTVDSQTRVIGQAMSDPAFRKRLLADPAGTLKGAGVEVPEGVTIQVVEDTGTKVHLVLPAHADEILDIDLDRAVGGMTGAGAKNTHESCV
ncbi:MAG TPA: NHLP leader peptide family RiPP precursor [Phenylobacterium sp.]|jgi:hypothetical protein|nr:NHLP leader peptide family RiPP precursor [Phenylobacterium sp.]